MSEITENFIQVRNQIRRTCVGAKRDTGDVQLVAVTKTVAREALEEAIAAGQRVFGENRVQEAIEHWRDLKTLYPDLQVHLIGPLQTNKVKDAVALFDCIETIDREKIARALADEMQKQGRNLPVLIQVNTGEEEQKAGVLPKDFPSLLSYCRDECRLQVRGLMCVPPVGESPGLHFAFLKKLARRYDLPVLSMGMSADYEKAIALGATHIRVGSALFGHRSM